MSWTPRPIQQRYSTRLHVAPIQQSCMRPSVIQRILQGSIILITTEELWYWSTRLFLLPTRSTSVFILRDSVHPPLVYQLHPTWHMKTHTCHVHVQQKGWKTCPTHSWRESCLWADVETSAESEAALEARAASMHESLNVSIFSSVPVIAPR